MTDTAFRKKEDVFDRFIYHKTNKSFKERLEENYQNVSAGYLYLCKEHDNWWCKKTREFIPISGNFVKVGVNCGSSGPWDRLRVLQQGNPRALKFVQLYIGTQEHIKLLEKMVLYATSYERNASEWIQADEGSLKDLIDELIEHFGLCVWHHNHTPTKMPYSAQNKSDCWLGNASSELQYQIKYLKKKQLVLESENTLTEIEEHL